MKIFPKEIARQYKNAMIFAAAYQIPLFFFSGFLLDGGFAAQMFGMGMVAFWPSVALIIRRSPSQPSRVDLLWIRAGVFLVTAMVYFLAPAIWHLRGVS